LEEGILILLDKIFPGGVSFNKFGWLAATEPGTETLMGS
jgi:hypothetical protein